MTAPDGVHVLDPGGAQVATLTTGAFPFAVAITADGHRVYIANSLDGTISTIDTGHR